MSIDKEIAKEKARLRQQRKSAYLKELSDSQGMSDDSARNFIRNKLDKNHLVRELAKAKDGALAIGIPDDCHRVRLPEVKDEMASLHPLIQEHTNNLKSKTLHFFVGMRIITKQRKFVDTRKDVQDWFEETDRRQVLLHVVHGKNPNGIQLSRVQKIGLFLALYLIFAILKYSSSNDILSSAIFSGIVVSLIFIGATLYLKQTKEPYPPTSRGSHRLP